jgi:hypothetical protein
MSAGVLLVSVVAVCAVLCGAAAAPARDNSPCRSPVAPYQIVDCAVILELAEILNEARLQERARVVAQELGKPSELDDAHMQQRAQAHAEQIGGGGSSSSTTSSSTTICYMGSYPYSEIPCGQMEIQFNKDKDEQVVREYAELMKNFENAHMQQRAQAHAEQIGGAGGSSSSSSSTTKCYMGSYPYSEIPCGQMEIQFNKDKDEQVIREYAELMKRLGK